MKSIDIKTITLYNINKLFDALERHTDALEDPDNAKIDDAPIRITEELHAINTLNTKAGGEFYSESVRHTTRQAYLALGKNHAATKIHHIIEPEINRLTDSNALG